jgi:endogenous inhibitor of DNA gyrase (YacG/DUF329 family)
VSGTVRFRCPTCQRPISWDEAFPYRPFCSERCKMVDFGAWVSGTHAIPGEPALPDDGAAPERDPDRGPH